MVLFFDHVCLRFYYQSLLEHHCTTVYHGQSRRKIYQGLGLAFNGIHISGTYGNISGSFWSFKSHRIEISQNKSNKQTSVTYKLDQNKDQENQKSPLRPYTNCL